MPYDNDTIARELSSIWSDSRIPPARQATDRMVEFLAWLRDRNRYVLLEERVDEDPVMRPKSKLVVGRDPWQRDGYRSLRAPYWNKPLGDLFADDAIILRKRVPTLKPRLNDAVQRLVGAGGSSHGHVAIRNKTGETVDFSVDLSNDHPVDAFLTTFEHLTSHFRHQEQLRTGLLMLECEIGRLLLFCLENENRYSLDRLIPGPRESGAPEGFGRNCEISTVSLRSSTDGVQCSCPEEGAGSPGGTDTWRSLVAAFAVEGIRRTDWFP